MRIGDVSKFLHISDQMIRYYEKNGVIHPVRSGSGNYREYSMMDVFLLYDAIRYKEWNINIKDIHDIINNAYYEQLNHRITSFIHLLDLEMDYKLILKNKLQRLSKELAVCKYNINNYWVEMSCSNVLFFSGTSKGDEYGNSQVDERNGDMIFSSKFISFFDVCVEFNKDFQTWYYNIDQDDYNQLGLMDYQPSKVIESRLCVCTIINMGEKGEFSDELLKPLFSFMKDKGYKQDGVPFGIILGRGKENNQFKRLMKIFVPIQSL